MKPVFIQGLSLSQSRLPYCIKIQNGGGGGAPSDDVFLFFNATVTVLNSHYRGIQNTKK